MFRFVHFEAARKQQNAVIWIDFHVQSRCVCLNWAINIEVQLVLMSRDCLPFAPQSQNIHQCLKSIQSENVKFECTLCISFRANNLLLFQHLCIVLTFYLTKNLNACFRYYLLLFNLVAAILNRRGEQLRLIFFLKLQIIVDTAERPVCAIVFVRLIIEELLRFWYLGKVDVGGLDATVS